MSISLVNAGAELVEMRAVNSLDRVAAAVSKLASVLEERVPLGPDIVGAAQACLLVPEAMASIVERATDWGS